MWTPHHQPPSARQARVMAQRRRPQPQSLLPRVRHRPTRVPPRAGAALCADWRLHARVAAAVAPAAAAAVVRACLAALQPQPRLHVLRQSWSRSALVCTPSWHARRRCPRALPCVSTFPPTGVAPGRRWLARAEAMDAWGSTTVQHRRLPERGRQPRALAVRAAGRRLLGARTCRWSRRSWRWPRARRTCECRARRFCLLEWRACVRGLCERCLALAWRRRYRGPVRASFRPDMTAAYPLPAWLAARRVSWRFSVWRTRAWSRRG